MKSELASYLTKQAFTGQLIHKKPDDDLGLIVVIPAHDEDDLIKSVGSLQACIPPKKSVEVIVVFNASETASKTVQELNCKAKEELEKWYKAVQSPSFQLFCLEENSLPKKHAGVGLARKIGMDEAVRRFHEVDNENGVIICFDADSQCEVNYLQEIEQHFKVHEKTRACSIHFEHPVKGKEHSEEVYRGIYYYELHLRYYKNGLYFAGLPYAFHTIGSSMAVRAVAYCREGGMNRRKAGEDFYFLQKHIDVGGLTELKSTKVIPSPRASHRVPFGTGRAIQEMIDQERNIEKSYSFQCFKIIKDCFSEVEKWYQSTPQFHPLLVEFLGESKLNSRLNEIKMQSTSKERFVKRFFQWFNAFQTLKFIHFLRDHHFSNNDLEAEVPLLLKELEVEHTSEDLLEVLREIDRS